MLSATWSVGDGRVALVFKAMSDWFAAVEEEELNSVLRMLGEGRLKRSPLQIETVNRRLESTPGEFMGVRPYRLFDDPKIRLEH